MAKKLKNLCIIFDMGKIKILFILLSVFLFFFACKNKAQQFYLRKGFVMSVPVEIKIYTQNISKGEEIAELIFKEIQRISDEFSYSEPYSYTRYINTNAYQKWVKIDAEMLRLLNISKKYYEITQGAFDITFAPLWPIWKEASANQSLPSREDISGALKKIGYDNIEIDEKNMAIRFKKSVEINLGGILRGYCFVKILEKIKREIDISDPIQIDIGANRLCWGERDWEYPLYSPFDEKKLIGAFKFKKGVIISSSGRSHFVKIGDKIYSHILNIKTGYPIENFSSMVLYLPDMDENFISSAALAVMGKEKAFDYISRINGSCAVWIDGTGNISTLMKEDSQCRFEKPKKFFLF